MGRPKLPTSVKEMTGTHQATREPELAKAIPMPFSASMLVSGNEKAEKLYWELSVHQQTRGLLQAEDEYIIALLALRIAEIQRLNSIIDNFGHTTYATMSTTGSTIHRPYPEVAQHEAAMKHAHALLRELGMTPATRGTMGKPPADGANAWSSFTQ